MRIVLLINRSAGSFRRLPVEATAGACAEALRRGRHDVRVQIADHRDIGARLTALALDPQVDAVVVGGGDGTVLTAVLAGLGQAKPLGLLPLGTLNLLARDLGLPDDPEAAALALATGQVAEIDLAEVNGQPFAIWASLGLHPLVVRRRDKLQRGGMGKWRAFALGALRVFRRYPLMRVTISARGRTVTIDTPLVVISNNAWREEPLPLSRVALDRGELEVHVAKCRSRLSLLLLAFNALLGRWKISRLLDTFTAREVRVTSPKRRVMLSLDGEVTVQRAPLLFCTRPKALRMIMPASAPLAAADRGTSPS